MKKISLKFLTFFNANKALPLKNNVSNNLYLYILEHKLLIKSTITDLTVFEHYECFDLVIDTNAVTKFNHELVERLTNHLSYKCGKPVEITIVDTNIWQHF